MIQSPIRHRRPAACAAAALLAILCVPLFTTVRGQGKSEPEKNSVPPPAPPAAESQPFRGTKLVADRMEKNGNTVSGFIGDEKIFQVTEVPAPPPAASGAQKAITAWSTTSSEAADIANAVRAAYDGLGTLVIDTQPVVDTPPGPLDNLRAVATKLREKGQTAEADAIEAELKNLSTPAHSADGKTPVPLHGASELQQLRSEMAEVKAALVALQAQRVAELHNDLVKAEVELDSMKNAGMGPRHPKLLALAAMVESMRAQLESSFTAETAARPYENALRRDVAKLKVQLASLANLKGEQLIAGFIESGLQNATIRKVYPEYQNDVAALGAAVKSGLGPTHPKVKGLKESVRIRYAQLEAAVETYRNNLRIQIEQAERMLADAKERDADRGRSAEAVKPTDQAREDLPWGVAVPEKKGRVFSPYTPEPSVVDVEGFKKGDKVKCPHTGNFFRVP